MDPAKPPFASEQTPPANGTHLHLTVREMRGFILRSRYWMIMGGAAIIVALAGPFYTLERLSFPARLIYWGITAIGSGIFLTFLSMLMRRIAAHRGLHWLPASLIAGALGILPTMALVHVANRVSTLDPGPPDFWGLFPFVSVPVVLITVLVNALADAPALTDHPEVTGEDPADTNPSDTGSTESAPSLLFSKLPGPLGQDIVSIQAKDHYIEVTTPLGTALILMRLSDAEQDLAALNGMRVHRSWWVNLAHVERIEKGTSGPELRMSAGHTVPVSRGQRAAVRAILG